MPQQDDTPGLSRPVEVADIPTDGIEGCIEASPSERAALVSRLDLEALDALRLAYTVKPLNRGRFLLSGHWRAEVTQTCGVTLEPIAHQFDESISIEFWPQEVWDRYIRDSGEIALDPDEETPELVANGIIDPGQLLEQLLIVALPQFPRRDNAALTWEEEVTRPESPFAVLKDLPKRNGDSS